MQFKLYGLLAETSIHPGTGQDAGFVDQPVAREATTDYPVIVGSAAKGALRDQFFWKHYVPPTDAELQGNEAEAKSKALASTDKFTDPIFGKSDGAGDVLVSDIRLLLLPVRSLTTSYVWITCSHLLERCYRDATRMGNNLQPIVLPALSDQQFLGSSSLPATIYLEERQAERIGDVPVDVVNLLKSFIPHSSTAARVDHQLAVISDTHFAWYARYGLPINARNSLNRKTKASKNLWYEETIPPDSLFYLLLAERRPAALNAVDKMLVESRYLQVGGNETVGQGWFAIQPVSIR